MVGRAGCGAEALHLLYQEGKQRALVLDGSLGHRIEIGLVGRATAFGHHDEVVLGSLCSLNIDLCREVATGVHLVVHRQRSILRVAQVLLGVGVEHTAAQSLSVIKTCPYLLSLLAVDDGRTRVLAERQNAFGCRLCIAQELQGHVLVVLRGLGIFQDGGHLLIVLAAQHELTIVEGLLSQESQGFGRDLENFFSFKFTYADAFLGNQTILGVVLTQLEHGCVLEINLF